MTKEPLPAPAEELAGPLEIEIDPSLIEEALAAVDRSLSTSGDGDEVELILDAPAAPPADPEDERRLLVVRNADLTVELARARDDLAHAAERLADLDGQLGEVRKHQVATGADFERFRQRARKDNEESERRGEERALRAMLEIFDNVERARTYDANDAPQVLAGLHMIVDQFRRQLLRVGFERITVTVGSGFDPEIHEAVAHVFNPDIPPGRIVEEVAAGFRLRGRLFRPARVTVAAPSSAGGE